MSLATHQRHGRADGHLRQAFKFVDRPQIKSDQHQESHESVGNYWSSTMKSSQRFSFIELFQLAVCAGIVMAATFLCGRNSMAQGDTNYGRRPTEIVIQKSALDRFLTPARMNIFAQANDALTLYIFPESTNGAVVIAVRDNCKESHCTTLVANLSWPGTPRSTVIDKCTGDFGSIHNFNIQSEHGAISGVISLKCTGLRGALAPTGDEGLSDVIDRDLSR